jgi:hypothetical protein
MPLRRKLCSLGDYGGALIVQINGRQNALVIGHARQPT